MQKECPFCNLHVVKASFAQTEGFYAIYNHAPVVPGHCMIIPFKHVTNLFELTDSEYITLFNFARDVTSFIIGFYGTDEFDMSLQQGFNAGQSIDHLHLHIIPRKANDLAEGEEWFDKLNENKTALLDSGRFLSEKEFLTTSSILRKAWNNRLDKK